MKVRVQRGLNLYYEKSGKGTPLILLHGNGEDHTIFEESVKLLEKKFTVYTLDSRGHGMSDHVKEFHYNDMAKDLHEFIQKTGIHRPYVCGFSDGAITALLLEIKYPGTTRGLISCGANSKPDGVKNHVALAMKLIYRFKKDPKIRMMLTEPSITEEELKSISVPVLVVAGAHDLIKEADTKFIASSIPDSVMMILPGEDHGSYIMKSQKLAHLLLEMIVERKTILNKR